MIRLAFVVMKKVMCNSYMRRFLLLSAMIMACCAAVYARHDVKMENDSVFGRTVVVEKEYNPDIDDADKVNLMPDDVEKISVPASRIIYADSPYAGQGMKSFSDMSLVNVGVEPQNAGKGLVYAGYGLRGKADAGFIFNSDIGRRDRIGINVAFRGEDDERDLDGIQFVNKEATWDAEYYDFTADLNYRHYFDGLALTVKGGTDYETFGYIAPASADKPHQHNLAGHVSADIISEKDGKSLSYGAGLEYRYFRNSESPLYADFENKQNLLSLTGNVVMPFAGDMSAGVDADFTYLSNTFDGYGNYATLSLNPFYGWSNEAVALKAGVNLDFGLSNGEAFLISPDVSLDVKMSGKYKLSLSATGGRDIADMNRINGYTPYWFMGPDDVNLIDCYVPLHAELALSGSPVSGFGFRLYGGYEINTDGLCFRRFIDDRSFIPSPYAWYDGVAFVDFHDSRKAFAGGRLSYEYRDVVDISVSGEWNGWTTAEADEYGGRPGSFLELKPEAKIKSEAKVRITDKFHASLSYCYLKFKDYALVDDVNQLNLRLSYTIFKGFGVYADGTNLLNKDYSLCFPAPAQKIGFTAGLSYMF